MIAGSHNGPHAITASTRQGPDSTAGRPNLLPLGFHRLETNRIQYPLPAPSRGRGEGTELLVTEFWYSIELPPNRGLQCFVAVAPRSVEIAARVQI